MPLASGLRSESVYLEDARETLPHAAIQVGGSKRVGILDLPLLEPSSRSCQLSLIIDCLLLIGVWRITGKTCPIEPIGGGPHEAVAAVADRLTE